MLRYSERATPALVRILKRYNDVTVFVEDTTNKNMYQIYFERMLGDKVRIKKIFPLGGKEKVIDAAKKKKFKRYEPCFFLIDGDLDLLRGVQPPSHEGLIRLSVYCSENLLFCEDAAIELAFESSSDASKKEIAKSLGFSQWRKEIIKKLKPLFLIYAAAQHFRITVQTVNLNANYLLEGSGPQRNLSERKISEKVRQVETEILKSVSLPELRRYIKSIEKKISQNDPESVHYFSGKTYLMPLLHNHLRKNTEFSDKEAAMKLRLARYARLDIDKGLLSLVDQMIEKSLCHQRNNQRQEDDLDS